MYEDLSILAAFVFLYSLTCGGLERTPINGAIVFTAFGLAFGSLGLCLLTLDVGAEGLNTLAELTLALVLFTDAANANLSVLKKAFHIPQRLLLIGIQEGSTQVAITATDTSSNETKSRFMAIPSWFLMRFSDVKAILCPKSADCPACQAGSR